MPQIMRAQSAIRLVLILVVGCLAWTGASTEAFAGDNDLVLRRLAEREPVIQNQRQLGFNAIKKDGGQQFRDLSLDLGLVFAPKLMAPAETLGEAGFDVGVALSVNTVNGAADHWNALEGSGCSLGATCGAYDPGPMITGVIQVRKGLPFSFELGGSLTTLFGSELVALGTDVKWALNEGFFVLPDFAVRGSVNNVVGSSDLNLTTAGFDASISKSFGVAGFVNITPYTGYNRLWVISSSRLLDVAPEDPTPPTLDENGNQLLFQPEFVFEQETQSIDRYFVGTRLIFVHATVTLEGAFTAEVNSYTARVGFDF